MTTCPGCGATLVADDLDRHERRGIVIVHCPVCGRTLGTYNSHEH